MNFWSLCRYWLSNILQVLTKTARALQHQVFFQHRPFARLNINSVPNLWWNLSIFPARMLKFYIMCLSYFKLNQKRILPISKYFASFLWSKKAFQLDCLAGASCVERLTKFLFAKFFSSSVQQRFWGGFVSLFGFCGLWGVVVLAMGTFVTWWQLVGKWSIYIVALLILYGAIQRKTSITFREEISIRMEGTIWIQAG